MGLPWLKPRFVVEAASLIILSERTPIPVPTLVAAGVAKNGLAFVETEYIFGSVRGDMAALDCRMPQLHCFQQPGTRCTAGENIIRANADRSVREVVLPRLARFGSNTTGLEGIVIPPRWWLNMTRGKASL